MSSHATSAVDDGPSAILIPRVLLVAAAALVGLAIAADGGLARAINGVGVTAWFVAAVLLVRSLRRSRAVPAASVTVAALVVALAFVVRPSDLVAAAVGFLAAGAVVARVARDRTLGWALLVPAGWLPAHVAVAIGRSVVRDGASIRTDPPPTTALVPLTMVLAAVAGATLMVRWRDGRTAERRAAPGAD